MAKHILIIGSRTVGKVYSAQLWQVQQANETGGHY